MRITQAVKSLAEHLHIHRPNHDFEILPEEAGPSRFSNYFSRTPRTQQFSDAGSTTQLALHRAASSNASICSATRSENSLQPRSNTAFASENSSTASFDPFLDRNEIQAPENPFTDPPQLESNQAEKDSAQFLYTQGLTPTDYDVKFNDGVNEYNWTQPAGATFDLPKLGPKLSLLSPEQQKQVVLKSTTRDPIFPDAPSMESRQANALMLLAYIRNLTPENQGLLLSIAKMLSPVGWRAATDAAGSHCAMSSPPPRPEKATQPARSQSIRAGRDL